MLTSTSGHWPWGHLRGSRGSVPRVSPGRTLGTEWGLIFVPSCPEWAWQTRTKGLSRFLAQGLQLPFVGPVLFGPRQGHNNPLQYSCLEWVASMGLLGVDWATSLSLFTFMRWRRKWQPTPVFLPGASQGRGSLVGLHGVGHDWSDLAAAAAAGARECQSHHWL